MQLPGHLTPDPPTVAKQLLDTESDGLSEDGKTPPQRKVVGKYMRSLDIAGELQTKLRLLQSLQTQEQRVPQGAGPQSCETPATCDTPLAMPPPPPPYSTTAVLPPPPPYGATAEGFSTLDQVQPRRFAPPPGLTRQIDDMGLKQGQTGQAGVGDFGTNGGLVFPPPGISPPDEHGSPVVTSIGSLGHPKNCGAACRYARRKGGCRNGASCLDCHQCQWRRDHKEATEDAQSAINDLSIGTKGHPNACGQACKYFRRKGGCRNGASCPDCHRCMWRRQPDEKTEGGAANADAEMVAGPQRNSSAIPGIVAMSQFVDQSQVAPSFATPGDAYPLSVGSIGHPFSCAGEGCKYNGKSKGCKDGRLCIRCHLCEWRRCHR